MRRWIRRDFWEAVFKALEELGIHDSKPQSISDLELTTGRKASNLSRTLRTMANYGLVRLEEGRRDADGVP